MDAKKIKILIGIGIGVGLYFLFNKTIKDKIAKTLNVREANFSNADGGNDYIAKKYDPFYTNPDGSDGATWISYNDSDVVGFWKKGKVQIGTRVSM